jgi:2-hydroxy-3-keto-5-methylthiopentenyl-1-phosphate phosphatase
MEALEKNGRPEGMAAPSACFVAIDFDGTVTDVDIIDAVLQDFARPEWRDVEALWEQGIIGSRECLERQMAMVEQPLGRLLQYVDGFSIDETFGDFLRFLSCQGIPYAIVSDGFQVFIERLLANAGLTQVPVLANVLSEERGGLKTLFPYADPDCSSANCKCMATAEPGRECSLLLVGDGRSDFCLAHKAAHVFSKKKLTEYCRANEIPHTAFRNFTDIKAVLEKKRLFASPLTLVTARKD